MLRNLVPSEVVSSVKSLDYRAKYKAGFRHLMFDLDNTLTTYAFARPDNALVAFINELKAIGFQVSIVSNSGAKRVDPFLQALGVGGRSSCKKPTIGVIKSLVSTDLESIILIGDQLLTDIWAANNLGIRSVLVHPIDESTDKFFTRMNRKLERFFVQRIRAKFPAVYDQRLKSRYE
jgi:HAD superfamily phosphatase (TIGR01668 family)